MTDLELKRLERSLSRSAMTAKPFYVRGMIGLTETEQGFFSIGIIPVYNPFGEQEVQLESVLRNIGTFYKEHKDLEQKHTDLQKEFNDYKVSQELKEKKMEQRLEDLFKRIKDLELFNLD